MARSWTVPIDPWDSTRPASNPAVPDELPTTLRRALKFGTTVDTSAIFEFTVPEEHAGTGTLKIDLFGCSSTVTAADGCRFDIANEFRTPVVGESLNVDAFDAGLDSGTMTFSTTAYAGMKLTITLTPIPAAVKGDQARIKVTRDFDHAADTLAVDFFLVSAAIYEEV